MPADLDKYYRDDSYNTPLQPNGEPIGGGPWLRMEDASDDVVGHYAINNGKMAVATLADDCPEGKAAVFLTRPTELNIELLQHAGFRHEGLFVPLSNGEQPEGTHQKQFSKEYRATKDFQNGSQNIEVILQMSKVTGVPFLEKDGHEEVMIPQYTDVTMLDTFNRSRGILTVIDEQGIQYIGKDSDHTRQYLQEHGFRHNPTIGVPFTHDETPVKGRDFIELMPSLASVVDSLQHTLAYKFGGKPKAAGIA